MSVSIFHSPFQIHKHDHRFQFQFQRSITPSTMDPNPTNFPILSYVMQKFPSFTRTFSTSPAADFDIENPRLPDPEPSEPHFELSEKMPHLKNPKLISSMRRAVSDVAQTRSVLKAIGPRPDHETLDLARSRVSVVESRGSGVVDKDYKTYKAVMALDEMHEAYGRMLSEAERRLERIYEAALAGVDVAEEMEEEEAKVVEMNEEVAAILKEAEMGKKAVERADLSGRQLRILPEAFGRINSLIVLNLSNNQLQVIPDSIARLENLEELNLSLNFLDSLPDSIGLLLKLKFLDVSHNKLVNLPDSIAHCRSLEELDASYNKLTYLPTNLGFELVNLKRLSIQLNKLRSLPTSVGEMKSLRLLDVHFNELRSLPYSIGNLTNLEILNLSSNFSDLTQLPDTISQLTNLRELDLSHNQIHALPDTFGELMNLTKLNLDENPIEVPPKRVADMGAEAVKKYMTKRWLDIQMEVEEKRNMIGGKEDEDGGLLTRSTSWLKSVVSTLGSMGKSDADRYLNQEF